MRVTILLIFCFSLVFTQEKTNLQKYIDLAIKNNTGLKPLEDIIEASQYKVEQARSSYYPQLNLSGSYTRLSLFGEFAFPYNGKMMNIKFGTPNNYSIKASISQQVFNWGRNEKTVEMNKVGVDIANTNLELNRFIISYQVVPLFYGTIFLKESIKVIDDNINLFQTKLDILKKRQNEGLASNFDITLIEFQINTLNAQKEDIINNLNKLKLSYNRLANLESNNDFSPEGTLDYQSITKSEDEYIKEAKLYRIEFKQLKDQENLTNTQLELIKTSDKPNLNFVFNYEFRNGFMPDMDKIKGNWNAILSFSYPVFDGFKTKYSIEESISNLKSIGSRKIDFEKGLETDIRQIISELKTIENKISFEKEKIKHSETALKIAEERYKNGLISATDLIESQNNYSNAKLNYLQLIYSHTLSRYNLYRTIGKLLY